MQSPLKPGQQRAALYKQSPARSPLRVMMKARCQERIRAGRDAVVGKHRKLGQHEVQSLMAEELQSWNKSRLPLTLGFSQEEVDEALAGLEEMERELLEELSIMPEEVSVSDEELLRRQPALICPVCKLGTLRQTSQFQVACEKQDCQVQLDGVVGGLEILGTQLEATLDSHNQYCSQQLSFAPGPDGSLLACCDSCQFLHILGGR